jgi:hypothetical protein
MTALSMTALPAREAVIKSRDPLIILAPANAGAQSLPLA